MMQKILALLLLLGLFACTDATLQEELSRTKAKLQKTEAQLIQLQQAKTEQSETLRHLVFLKLKPTANLDSVFHHIRALAAIDLIQDLEYGSFENLDDNRALAEYHLLLQMKFAKVADYEAYQQHPLHRALKENTRSMLAGPPATFDMIIE